MTTHPAAELIDRLLTLTGPGGEPRYVSVGVRAYPCRPPQSLVALARLTSALVRFGRFLERLDRLAGLTESEQAAMLRHAEEILGMVVAAPADVLAGLSSYQRGQVFSSLVRWENVNGH